MPVIWQQYRCPYDVVTRTKLSMPSSTWEAVRKGDVLKNGFVFPLLKEGPQRDIYHIFQFQYLQTL